VPEYVRLVCGVPPFSIDYSYMHGGYPLSSAEVLCGLGLLVLLVAAAVISWRTEKSKAIGFGLLWTGLFLLPVSNLVPMMQYMAERFLYLPLIGWLIALTGVLSFFSRQKMARAAMMGLILLWAIIAWNRSWIWHDEVTLFVRSSQKGPKTQRIESNAVHAILDLPSIRQIFISQGPGLDDSVRPAQDHAVNAAALALLAEAHRLFPENPDVLSHYGIALAATGDPEQALPFLTEAARLEPEKLMRWLNLARAAMDTGHPDLAEPALQKAGALASNNPDFMQLEFKYYWMTGNFAAARDAMQKLNAIVPTREHADWLSEAEQQLKLQEHPTNAVPVSAK
jgi:tetratricopeptide (TPR) repeat protein